MKALSTPPPPGPMTHALRLSFIVVFVLALSGCDAAGPEQPGPGPEPGPGNTSIRVDFNYVEAVKDCDGFPLGEGEFSFGVYARPSFGSSTTVYTSNQRGFADGQRSGALGQREFTTTAVNGQEVTIEFKASEVDYDIFGNNPFNDSRMSSRTQTTRHTFDGRKWSGSGPQTITMGSGDCQVRLSYTVSEI